MNLFDKFRAGLPYTEFLVRYANESQKQRWHQVFDDVKLTPPQRDLLATFVRPMNVLCLAGAWCGDCIAQCPVFEHFAAVAPVIQVRYLDRDEHADVQRALQINGGNRVPVVVFLSEDGFEAARYGDRTASKYRAMIRGMLGPDLPTAPPSEAGTLLAHVTQDWLNEFERIQWMLRLSPRLRQARGD